MITSKIREQDDHFVIEVPKEEIQRLDLKNGQEVSLTLAPLDPDVISDARLEAIVARLVEEHRDALDYLGR